MVRRVNWLMSNAESRADLVEGIRGERQLCW